MLTADPIAVSDASGIGTHRAALASVVLLVVLGIALRGYFFEPQIARSPDEYTYTWQANLILQRGSAAFGLLGDQVLANPAAFAIRPSPIRAAYLWLLAGVMNITGEHGLLAGAYISLVASCLNLCLLAFAAWRWLSPRAALIAALFCSTFPCDLVIARRAWQDAWIELLCDLVLVAALALFTARPQRSAVLLTSIGALGVLCALTKENAALFFVLSSAVLAVWNIFRRNLRLAILVTAVSAAALFLAFAILAVLFHGPGNLIHVEQVCMHFSALGAYELQFDTGTPMMFVHLLALVSPVLTCTAVAACVALGYRRFALRTSTEPMISTLTVLLFCMLAIQVSSGRYNLRYAAPVYGSLILLAAWTLDQATSIAIGWMDSLGRPVAIAAVIIALAAGALRDLNFGRDHLLNTGIQDLALRPVLGAPAARLSNPSDLPVEEIR
ncbi:MAG TPA: hypothetical protein VFN62_05835 [Acidobacteriaceae bacterium]|nr:hypothetical protein [Acidobacteriaceae bacterium]